MTKFILWLFLWYFLCMFILATHFVYVLSSLRSQLSACEINLSE